MVKHTQTVRRQIADELFECVWPVGGLTLKGLKYKIMFNQLTKPREFPSFNSETIHLLFCNNSTDPPTPFRHNHYLPLIFCSEKNKVNKTRTLVTSEKCQESKKRATYSIHHFWKQDLSVNNALSNFTNDLMYIKVLV